MRLHRATLLLLLAGVTIAAFSMTFTHLAGSFGGPGFEDGTGAAARFHGDAAVAVDAAGNLYIADAANHTIRKVSSSGVVTTLAGFAESPGFADGRGAHARFNSPQGIAVDGGGVVYVSDFWNHSIRKITPTGVVSTLTASGSLWPRGLTIDSLGYLYVADAGSHSILRVEPNGTVTTLAGTGVAGNVNDTGTNASFNTPQDIVYDAVSNALYVADSGNNVIRKITLPGAVVTTYAGTMNSYGHADGAPGLMYRPRGVCIDGASGTLYVSDDQDHTIRSVVAGSLGSVAGSSYASGASDGSGTNAQFNTPSGVAFRGSTLYVADSGNNTVRAIAVGTANVTTFAGLANESGYGNLSGSSARFNNPTGVAYYPGPPGTGFAYIADTNNNAIRRVGIDGTVVNVAGGTWGYANGFGNAAAFRQPRGVALHWGNYGAYVADTGNHCIRFVDRFGNATLFAGQPTSPGSANGDRLTTASFNSPAAVAANPSGTAIYVADTGNYLIRKIVLSTGVVSTLAGSGAWGSTDANGTSASFGPIYSLMVDSSDNVYVAEEQQGTIRKITPARDVTTIAGSFSFLPPADGTGLAARFGYPGPEAVAGAWGGTSSFVADRGAQLIRTFDTSSLYVGTAGGLTNVSGTSDGTGSFARFDSPKSLDALWTTAVITEGNTIRFGGPEIADRATIDSFTGSVGTARQLDTSPQTATAWTWSIVRRPSGSTASLSSTSVRNPTFTPDVPDLYVFRCVASSANGTSISTVTLQASGTATSLGFGYPAPYPATYGSPFSIMLYAYDADFNLAAGYTGTVHFSSTDASAVLPGNYTFTAADHGVHAFSGTAYESGTLTAADTVTGSMVGSVWVPVNPLAPTGLSATATDPAHVALSWTASSPASYYEITRASSGGAYTTTVYSPTTNYTDTAVSPGASYVYQVRAMGSSGGSAYSGPDVASTFIFTDDPLSSGNTFIKAAHVTELVDAVNAFRFAAGLPPISLSSGSATGLPVKASQILELRTGLNEARAVFTGLSAVTYTDPTLTAGTTTIKAAHVQEIRAGVK